MITKKTTPMKFYLASTAPHNTIVLLLVDSGVQNTPFAVTLGKYQPEYRESWIDEQGDAITDRYPNGVLGWAPWDSDSVIINRCHPVGREYNHTEPADTQEHLRNCAMRSVLPMIVSESGQDTEPVLEVISCTSISGGSKYIKEMPGEVTLSREFPNGRHIEGKYALVSAEEVSDANKNNK